MKKTERLLLELFFKKKEPPPTRTQVKKLKPRKRLSVDEFIELVDDLPDLRKRLEEALKKMEPHKHDKKSELSHLQKYMLITVAAFTLPLAYVYVLKTLF